jgi:mRNA interferase MazF
MKRGDVYMIDLSPVVGSEQGGYRPCIIIQNDIGNRFSPTVIVAAITSKIKKEKMPTHVAIGKKEGLQDDSVILCEQIRTVDKSRLTKYICSLSDEKMKRVNQALLISLGMFDFHNQLKSA